jgi:hypothetical protein
MIIPYDLFCALYLVDIRKLKMILHLVSGQGMFSQGVSFPSMFFHGSLCFSFSHIIILLGMCCKNGMDIFLGKLILALACLCPMFERVM